jgi:hypothetical protein
MEDSLQVFQNARFREYIQVVDKQSVSLEEHCAMYIDRCRNVLERIEAHQNKKTNDTLLVLTILTALMLPVQFLTGVWGMNFSVMPELEMDYGYFLFWALVPTLSGFTYWYMRHKGMVTTQMDDTVGSLLPKKMLQSIVKKFKATHHDGAVGMRNLMHIPMTMKGKPKRRMSAAATSRIVTPNLSRASLSTPASLGNAGQV